MRWKIIGHPCTQNILCYTRYTSVVQTFRVLKCFGYEHWKTYWPPTDLITQWSGLNLAWPVEKYLLQPWFNPWTVSNSSFPLQMCQWSYSSGGQQQQILVYWSSQSEYKILIDYLISILMICVKRNKLYDLLDINCDNSVYTIFLITLNLES